MAISFPEAAFPLSIGRDRNYSLAHSIPFSFSEPHVSLPARAFARDSGTHVSCAKAPRTKADKRGSGDETI